MKGLIVFFAAVAATIVINGNARADDNAAGKSIFARTCANCHSTEIGVNKIGPSLWNVAGRPIASVPDFSYSEKLVNMRNEWKAWDEKLLDAYLTNPREVLHGVKMYFKGLPDPKDRADVIRYLTSLRQGE
jgi:cytochrome c